MWCMQLCMKAKQHRLPFKKSELVLCLSLNYYTWIYGVPYKTPSLNGSSYILTIVDDQSRTTWIYLLPNKQNIPNLIDNFLLYIQNQFECNTKRVRTDNGKEFTSAECHAIFTKNRIDHHLTCPHTPHKNGRVEIKHKHLLQLNRALLFQAKLPNRFWEKLFYMPHN